MAALETPITSSSQVNSIENQNFERNALKFFNELQEANNRGDISFMQTQTIEPLSSILISDIQNRTNASRTQVMMMNPKLLDMTEEADRSIASVRFTGMVREDENAAPDNVDEVWHFVRLAKSSNDWQLAGIEQV
jgi:predicted lipid-binding transport protein (Tim44 family)